MPLKMPCDEIVLGANEMQHLDHRAVGRDSGAGGEDDREHGRAKHEQEKADAEHNDRAGYGTHTVDEAAMVVEANTWYLFSKRLAQLPEVRRGSRRDPHDDQPRDRQIIELKPASQPRLEQLGGLFLGIGSHLGDARGSAGDDGGLDHFHLDVATGHWADLDRDFARHIGLPFGGGGAHQHDRARGQRSQKRHDGDDRNECPAGNCRLRHDGALDARQNRRG